MAHHVSIESDLISSLGRAAHDVGVGALVGGNLFARLAMHPSLVHISDKRERGKVLNSSWQRYGPVNTAALTAIVLGWGGARLGEARPSLLSPAERRLALAKDLAVGGVAITGVGSAAAGMRFARTAPDGAVPMKDGDVPSKRAGEEAQRLKKTVNVLGSLHLASAITLAGINAALAQANFRRPPARRLLRHRY
jgi:hypothetical protein